MIVCGIMTGTSLDAIDIAICEFSTELIQTKCINLILHKQIDFSKELKYQLFKAITSGNIQLKDFSQLNFCFTYAISDAIKQTCLENNFPIEDIDLIGVHGQTLWHNPQKELFANRMISSTYQLFSGTALSALLNKPVVFDFRSADIALGGQAAPLVPIFDYYFFQSNSDDVIALNIGGISNITYIPQNANMNDINAFDVGSGNCLIDLAAKKLLNLDYDNNGDIAREGETILILFDELCKIEFIYQKPPKSSGRELFNEKLISDYIFNYKAEDIIRTLTEFTVHSISYNIRKFANEHSKIIASGGGCNNKFLMELLRYELKDANIINSNALNIPIDAKESIAFAFLAYLTYNQIPNNIPNATGANSQIVLGAIANCIAY